MINLLRCRFSTGSSSIKLSLILAKYVITSPVVGVQKYCDEYVCLSVCSHILETILLNFTNFRARCL